MTNAKYSDIVQALGNVRSNIMNREMTDDGWDLRDDLLALQEALALVATTVYESTRESRQGLSREAMFLESYERAIDDLAAGRIPTHEFLDQAQLIRKRYRAK